MARARWAENLAARFYEQNGYEIVARNWHCREGELDIVAILASAAGVVIAIVEVKARATTSFGSPFEAVNQVKQKSYASLRQNFSLVTVNCVAKFDLTSLPY
ncbi:UPF0102 protein NFA_41430 [Acidimicrobiaceae bacterium]|nr:UPF0102 protein NFA_41430 [Acidimicrobiaceae bacterium]